VRYKPTCSVFVPGRSRVLQTHTCGFVQDGHLCYHSMILYTSLCPRFNSTLRHSISLNFSKTLLTLFRQHVDGSQVVSVLILFSGWFDRVCLLFITRVRMRFNCSDKTNWKILVPGNVNNDSPSFSRVDKSGHFVRNPSLRNQFHPSEECLTSGREGRGVPASESRRTGVKCNFWWKSTHPEDD
jgi:hypothetical protein